MSHTFCNFPSSCLGDTQLLFLAYLHLVKSKSKMFGFVWTGKRSGQWSRKKIPLQLNCSVMSWLFFLSSHPISHESLLMPLLWYEWWTRYRFLCRFVWKSAIKLFLISISTTSYLYSLYWKMTLNLNSAFLYPLGNA